MTRTSRYLACAAGVLTAGAAYAFMIEPRWLESTRTRVHVPGLPLPLEGLTITLLTDFHTGRSSPSGLVGRAVRRTQAAYPDLVAITGDIAGDEASLERTLDQLATLRAPLGVYIVPGNHDYRIGIERWHDAVSRRPSLMDLTNRVEILDVPRHSGSGDYARVCVAGVDDYAEGTPRLDGLHTQTRRDLTILLAHNPDQAEAARRGVDQVDVVLSGHTHGGQVRLPGIGALVNSAEHEDLYEAGLRRRPWTQVYTSRGIGTAHLPVRFMTRPELAFLTLTGKPRPQRRRR